MDKQTFTQILQSALLCFDGVQEAELIKEYDVHPKIAKVGVQLCNYLKSKSLEENE